MPLVVKDRVRETTTTTGTGTITLAGAIAGFQSFSAIGNANTTYYTINLPGANEWEVGLGTYTASGTTLSRDTILASSNSGSAVNFSAGTKDVFCTYPAGRSVYYDTSTNVSINNTLDLTNLEVTNIKAKDGTASITLADSTGVATFSANPILNAGTANGVPYLNASKVVTTGSALTFDGSEIFKNSGGTIQNNDVRGSAAAGTRLSAGGTLGVDSFDLFQNALGGYVFNRGNTPLIFGANNTEWMRLTSTGTLNIVGAGTAGSTQAISFNGSTPVDTLVTTSGGNVGIGTNAPTQKLTVNSGSATTTAQFTSTGSSVFLGLTNSGASAFIGADSAGSFIVQTPGSSYSTKLTVDTSGNLGLGVTPSTWGTDYKAIQIGGSATGALSYKNFVTSLSQNVYSTNANDVALVGGNSAKYELNASGEHVWKTATAVTANTTTITNGVSYTIITSGNQTAFGAANNNVGTSFTATSSGTLSSGTVSQNISFTQALTLTANRNLLVGITSENSGNGGLKVAGQFALTTSQAFTTSGSVNDTAYYIVCYSLSGTCTLTLPTPANNTGRLLNIVVQSAQQVVSASSNVTKITDGTLTTDILPATAGKWAQLWCDGTYWNIIATNV